MKDRHCKLARVPTPETIRGCLTNHPKLSGRKQLSLYVYFAHKLILWVRNLYRTCRDGLIFLHKVWGLFWGCFKGLCAGIIWRLLHFHLCLVDWDGSTGPANSSTYIELLTTWHLDFWKGELQEETQEEHPDSKCFKRNGQKLRGTLWSSLRSHIMSLLPYSIDWSSHKPTQKQREGLQTPLPNGKCVKDFEAIF